MGLRKTHMKSIEERVLELFKETYPDPMLAADIEKKVSTNKSAIAAVIQRLYEKDLIICEGGGFVIKKPRRLRSIDANWEG